MENQTLVLTEVGVDNLVIEAGEVRTRTVLANQVLPRGTAVTLTAGKLVKTVANGDIYGIIKDDIDTTGADALGGIYYTGKYKKSIIESVTGITITNAMEDTMRTNQLILG